MTDASDRASMARRILPLLDLTSLGDNDNEDDVGRLCEAATTAEGSVASVCIWPRFVALAVEQLEGTHVDVCAVANFPAGEANHRLAVDDALSIVDSGGAEVDVVVPWHGLITGRRGEIQSLLTEVREAIGETIVLKAILETGELADTKLIAQAGTEALDGGADFLKTSTGKTAHSATLQAAETLLGLIAERTAQGATPGLKISGGVRDLQTASGYIELADRWMGPDWAGPTTFRFGASGLLDDLLATLDTAGQ